MSRPVPLARRGGDVLARALLRAADAAAAWATRRLGAGAEPARRPRAAVRFGRIRVGRPIGATRFRRARLTGAQLRELALDGEERRIIDEVFAAGSRHIAEVMVPRVEVWFLDAGLPLPAAVDVVRGAGKSRFPVIEGGPDEVIGFVHLRDLLLRPARDTAAVVGDLVRDVARLPAVKPILPALSEMRRAGRHLAVVVDEYGGTAGIVTLEDLIEELIGEIHDEYDPAPEPPLPEGATPEEVDGRLNLADFAELTGLTLPFGPYETVGGFLMARLGRVPAVGDQVALLTPPQLLVVTAVDGRRVARVALAPAGLPGQRDR